MIPWSKILVGDFEISLFDSFARGVLPKNSLLQILAYTPISGPIRRAIRERGTARTRDAARKAISRREFSLGQVRT